VREESVDLRLTHLLGVALVVEEDVTADPPDVGLFGAQAVVAGADGDADAVEELRRLVLARESAGEGGDRRQGLLRHFAFFSG